MHPLVYEYFKQLFAQVTNPPIDPFREKIVMSLACPIGPESNLLMPSGSECRRLWLENPIISLHDLEVLKHTRVNNWKSAVLDITYDVNDAFHLSSVIDKICKNAAEEVINGNQFIVLSDRNVSRNTFQCRIYNQAKSKARQQWPKACEADHKATRTYWHDLAGKFYDKNKSVKKL